MEIRNFLSRSITFYSILFLLGYLLFSILPHQFYHQSFLIIFIYFVVITTVAGLWFIRLVLKKPEKFSFYYFISTGTKFLLHFCLIVVLLIIYTGFAGHITLFYLGLYLLIRSFEILVNKSLSHRIRH